VVRALIANDYPLAAGAIERSIERRAPSDPVPLSQKMQLEEQKVPDGPKINFTFGFGVSQATRAFFIGRGTTTLAQRAFPVELGGFSDSTSVAGEIAFFGAKSKYSNNGTIPALQADELGFSLGLTVRQTIPWTEVVSPYLGGRLAWTEFSDRLESPDYDQSTGWAVHRAHSIFSFAPLVGARLAFHDYMHLLVEGVADVQLADIEKSALGDVTPELLDAWSQVDGLPESRLRLQLVGRAVLEFRFAGAGR
jgi:hypothetical protein